MEQISKYFNAEKSESLLFVVVGVVAILLSAYFFIKVKQPFYNGMAYSLIAIAIIQLIVGGEVYFRSPKDITRVNQIVQTETIKIQTEEIPRMEIVMKKFVLYRWIEIGCLLIGVLMFFYFPPMTLLKGVGIGLAIQAGFMLLLDYFAEERGEIYLNYLQSIN
jgi:multidrug transporter EmrE-like cation transporter